MSKASQIRQKAQEFLGKGQIEKAIAEYKRLLSVESKNPNLYNELGDIYLRAADKPQAVQNFEKAAVIYEKVALYNNAVAVCKKILRVDPEKSDTIFKLGELRAKQKLEGEATTYFAQYADVVLSNPQSGLAKSQKDIERMLELMPSSEPLLAKAAEIYDLLGLKLKSAELLSKLAAMAVEKSDPEKHRQYSKKLADIKSTLTADEARQASAFTSADAPGEAEGASAEVRPAAAGASAPATAAIEPHPMSAAVMPEASQADEVEAAEECASDTRIEETPEEEAPPPPEMGEDDNAAVREAVEEAEMLAAMSRGADLCSSDATSRALEQAVRGAAPAAVAEKPLPTKAPAPEAPSPTIEVEARGVSGGADGSRRLVEEITSDVEKDDLKSHYDLGMAYLEMGLYNEAIKDFQISSRCEELKLSSMEMIGHCFLKQDSPRLAVKQLAKALEVAHAAGGESLGIHYNLGLAHEMLGELEQAREHFEEVYIVDMSFREVAEKMRKLGAGS